MGLVAEVTTDNGADGAVEDFSAAPVRLNLAALAGSVGVSALVLVANLATGVLTARSLDTAGKGELAALFVLVTTLGNLSLYGLPEALTYRIARTTQHRESLATSGIVASLALAVPAVAIGEAVIGWVFAAQRPEFVSFARAALIWVGAFMVAEAVIGALAGRQDFRWANSLRAVQPVAFLLALLVALATTDLTVGLAAVLQAGSTALAALLGLSRLVTTRALGRPSLRAMGFLNAYGRRAWGMRVGHQLAARADLVILPAFVIAADLGIYSVAVSVASMVIVLFGQIERVIYGQLTAAPAPEAKVLFGRAIRLTLAASLATGAVLALLAKPLLRLAFGAAFTPAAVPLWILLPGTVAVACGMVLGAGLGAAGMPGRASVAQLVGLAVTLAGLALTVAPFGIIGAAATSTVAYLFATATALFFLRRAGWLGGRPVVEPSDPPEPPEPPEPAAPDMPEEQVERITR